MKARSLSNIAAWIDGALEHANESTPVTGASIDTRSLRLGDLFFALPGGSSHGIDFAAEARRAGAVAVVTTPELRDRVDGPALLVKDPRKALGEIARQVREEEKNSLPAVAITGSVGKTTTCRYLTALLKERVVVHRPPGSFNNDLGVPLTILNAPADCELIVSEVGANGPGEIARLGGWVQPRVACVTAIGPAHLAGFGSMEAIQHEKLSLLECLEPTGVGWIPADIAAREPGLLAERSAPVFTFGPGGNLEITPNGKPGYWCLHWRHEGEVLRFPWEPPFPHSMRNLEAALGLCIALGQPVGELLERIPELRLPRLRGEAFGCEGVNFLLDCYNSNPMSLESAIERLEQEPTTGRRVAVVGTMEELGAEEQEWHVKMGRRLADARLDAVFVLGRGREWLREGLRDAGGDGVPLAHDVRSAELLADSVGPGDHVLFKASRAEALETFAERVARLIRDKKATPVRAPR